MEFPKEILQIVVQCSLPKPELRKFVFLSSTFEGTSADDHLVGRAFLHVSNWKQNRMSLRLVVPFSSAQLVIEQMAGSNCCAQHVRYVVIHPLFAQ